MRSYVSFTVVLFSLFSISAWAQKTKSSHHEHEAHVHGSANLAIAFDGLKGRIEFKAAAEGILGFEHAARSAAEQKALTEAKAKFEKIDSMVQFDSSLGCKIQPEKIDMQSEETGKDHAKEKHHGEHSNFVANFNVACEKSVTGSKMKIDFTTFPKLNDLDITVLVGDLQKSAEAKKQSITLDLSK